MSDGLQVDQLLTADQVASLLGLKRDTVLLWFRDGRLPGQKLGYKTVRFTRDDVMEAMRVQAQRTAASAPPRATRQAISA
jgi:excisionase family DNA binding protein